MRWARRSSASRRDPPDPQRHARRPAGRDARAARDHRGDPGRVRILRLRRGRHARAGVRDRAHARRPGGGRPGLQAVRRARQRARPALGHDDPDRARGGDAATRPPSRRCASATSPTPTAPCGRSAGRRARCCRRGWSWSARPGRRAPRRRSPCWPRASRPPGCENYRIGLGDASLYPRLLDRARRAGGRAAADPARAGHARLRRPRARGGGARARRAAARAAAARRRRGARRGARRRSRCARSTTGWRPPWRSG